MGQALALVQTGPAAHEPSQLGKANQVCFLTPLPSQLQGHGQHQQVGVHTPQEFLWLLTKLRFSEGRWLLLVSSGRDPSTC